MSPDVRRICPSGPASSAQMNHDTSASGATPRSSSFNMNWKFVFAFAVVCVPSEKLFGSCPATV